MAEPQRRRNSQLTRPGQTTETLRNICQIWNVSDVATVIPERLHPQHEHRANYWSSKFQEALKDVAQVVRVEELEEFKEKCESAVEIRCNKRPKRATYLIVDDLKNVERVFCHKRTKEMDDENQRRAKGEAHYWFNQIRFVREP
jgi:hypothetical protein